ncbi:hypothetical protein XENOCAPTIV_001207, partial [Xenoophorus captivus]
AEVIPCSQSEPVAQHMSGRFQKAVNSSSVTSAAFRGPAGMSVIAVARRPFNLVSLQLQKIQHIWLVFRRRRRTRRFLVSLLSDVTESCHSWLDQKVFRGMLGARRRENLDLIEDQDLDWAQISKEGPSPSPLDESLWLGLNSTELDDSRSFTYDPTEAPPPPDKEAPPLPKLLIQEEICSEICQSKERFTQSLGGLSEVPPPPAFYSCCCQTSPEPTGELGHLQTLHTMTGNRTRTSFFHFLHRDHVTHSVTAL